MINILTRLKEQGFDTVPEDFYRHIDVWQSWYNGKVDHFHKYRVFNGQDYLSCERFSMGMAKLVCEDWANLLMNEKVHITLEGEAEQDFFNSVCENSNFTVRCNEMQELKAALGTVAYVPRATGMRVDPASGAITGGADDIKIDFVYGENIMPLSWDNREVTECAFATSHTTDNNEYLFVQTHRLNARGEYDIENHLYDAKNDGMTEVPLSDADAFKNIPAVIHTGSKKRQFVIDRMNIVNNIDPTLPMGVAVFSNAIDQLKAVDVAYDSYVNEFVLGKKRIMVKLSAMKDFDGNMLFDPTDVAYYWLPEDSQDGNTIQEINMELRSAQHNAGMQDMLNALSAKCGFGEKHFSYSNGSVATATQIVSENSTLFRAIKKHEIVLDSVLKELARIILRMGNQYMGMKLDEDVEISIDFDDSIIEDEGTEFQRDLMMLQSGIMNAYEFRMKWMNEDEDTAKAALPQMANMLTEPMAEEE